jgi:Ca-activated chloride channel family protein
MATGMSKSRTGCWLAVALCGIAGLAGAAVPESAVRCRVELDREVLPAGGAQKAVLKVTLDAATPAGGRARPPVNLAVVLDKSGSMRGEKIEKAKQAAIEAVRRLDARDVFSLVVYDSHVRTVVPAQSVANAVRIEERIREIKADGNTALFGGVSEGAAEIRKNLEPKYVHRIILLSDGLANVGPSTPEDLARLGAALIKEGITVTTVGVGTDYNEDLMARLAQKSDGNTYFVKEVAELTRIFKAELGDVLNVVAKKVRISVECPDGVRPVSILGREGRIAGAAVELYLNQLYGGQEKYALVEVELPLSVAGDKRDVAVARVAYEDPLTGKEAAATATATARFSADSNVVARSFNAAVQNASELNRNALAQEEAIALADKGKAKEAAQRLVQSAQQLRQVAALTKDAALEKKAQEVERQADRIGQQGMGKEDRKQLRADAHQMVNQQTER